MLQALMLLALGLGLVAARYATGANPRYGPTFAAFWLVVLPAALVVAVAARGARLRLRLDPSLFYAATVLGVSALTLVAALLATDRTPDHEYLTDLRGIPTLVPGLSLRTLCLIYLLGCGLVTIAALVAARARTGARAAELAARIAPIGYVLFPISVAAVMVKFLPPPPNIAWLTRPTSEVAAVLAAGVAVGLAVAAALSWVSGRASRSDAAARARPAGHPARARRRGALIDLGVLVALALVAFDPTLPTDFFHQYAFVMPVHAVLGGRTLLHDISSGNGVGVILAFAAVVGATGLPHTAQSLTAVNSVLLVAEYWVVYLLACWLLRSRALGLAATALVVWFNYLSAPLQLSWYIQQGPTRFGFPLFLLALCAARSAFPRVAPAIRAGEWALIGLASIWMLEAFAYVLATYAAILIYEQGADLRALGKLVRAGLVQAVGIGLAVVAAQAAVALMVLSRTGHWPDWGQYLVVFATLAPGYDAHWVNRQMPIWSPWAVYLATYALSLTALAYRRLTASPFVPRDDEKIALGLTLCGVIQFSYHLVVVFPYSLHPISIPPVLLALYWLRRLWDERARLPRPLVVSAAGSFAAGLAVMLLAVLPGAAAGVARVRPVEAATLGLSAARLAPDAARRELATRLRAEPSTIDAAEAVALIRRHAPDKDRLGVFLYDGIATSEALSRAGAIHAWPMDYPTQDTLHEAWRRRSIAAPPPVVEGDVIFVDPRTVNYLQRLIVRRLCGQFSLEPLEVSESGVAALRLGRSDGTAGTWCATHFAPFVRAADGAVFAIQDGLRRRLPDEETLARLSGSRPDPANVVPVRDDVLASIPEGLPLPSAADRPPFVAIGGQWFLIQADGRIARVPDDATLSAYGWRPEDGLVVRDGSERFWATSAGHEFHEVRPRTYFGLEAALIPAAPTLPSVLAGGALVTGSDGRAFAIWEGARRPLPNIDRDLAPARDALAARAVALADTTLAALPEGPPLAGLLVRDPDGHLHLVSEGTRRRVRLDRQAAEALFSVPGAAPTVESGQLDRLRAGEEVRRAFVQGRNGLIYRVEGGVRRWLPGWTEADARGRLGSESDVAELFALGDWRLNMLPLGPDADALPRPPLKIEPERAGTSGAPPPAGRADPVGHGRMVVGGDGAIYILWHGTRRPLDVTQLAPGGVVATSLAAAAVPLSDEAAAGIPLGPPISRVLVRGLGADLHLVEEGRRRRVTLSAAAAEAIFSAPGATPAIPWERLASLPEAEWVAHVLVTDEEGVPYRVVGGRRHRIEGGAAALAAGQVATHSDIDVPLPVRAWQLASIPEVDPTMVPRGRP